MEIILFMFTLFSIINFSLMSYNQKSQILNKNENKYINKNILFNDNIAIRKLTDDENTKNNDDENVNKITENKNNTKKEENNTNNNNDKDKQKNSMGALGVIIIILLSIAILYIAFSGFRHYRRKKYQNPSFYYKITEEMFDDITPIE